ncbi:HAD-IA family hydrolase [Helicobacter pylori]
MNKNKVLLITPELEYTGALNSFKRMCQTLLKNGFDVDVWSYEFGPFIEELDALGILTECISEREISQEWVEKRIFKYNLVIANTVVVYKAVEFIQEFLPMIWYVREAENLPNFFWIPQRKVALENAKKIYVVSEYAKDFIVKNYNQNVEVLHNYVDDVFEVQGCYIKDKNSKQDGKLRFLALGTIEERKGYDVLIDAFISLPKEIREQCELHFAGRLWEGAEHFYPKLLEQIKPYKNIFYHGELRDKKSIYKLLTQSDVVVVPSRDESCSLVALEGAMMARVLILSQNIGAKYILNENNGICVKTGCINALKEAFIRLFKNRSGLDAMGREARKAYLNTSTYEIYAKNFMDVIEKELASNSYLYRVQNGVYQLYSFDVFDTLLMRKVAEPKAIFALMQERIKGLDFPLALKENFAKLRVETEGYYYHNVCKKDFMDVCFEEIYDLLALNFSLSSKQKEILMNLEIEVERENFVPIEKNIKLLEKMVEMKKNLILVSDMYFNAKQIRQFLLPFSKVFADIFIYVSSEYRKKKNNGALFKIIMRQRKIKPEFWLHFGDNFLIDCVEAKKLGINFHYYENDLLSYEKFAIQNANSLNVQKMLAKTRNFRTQNKLSFLEELGACFGGFLFLPYAYYVLRQAVQNDIKILYFVARDGFILQKICEKIIQKENLNIQTRYIYGSRSVWREPFEKKDEEKINLMKAYLRQELNINEKFAFVEVTGTGATLDRVAECIDTNLKHLFFGAFYLHRSELKSEKRMFMMPNIYQSAFKIEFFCRSLEGQVLAYKIEAGKIVPICCEVEGAALEEFGYGFYIDGLLKFVDFILQDLNYKNFLVDFTLSREYLRYLASENIDKNFIELVGSVPFALDELYKDSKCNVVAKRFFVPEEVVKEHWATFPWSILRSHHSVKGIYDKKVCEKISVGSVDRVQNHLSYKLGNILLRNAKNPFGIIKLIFLIPMLVMIHKEEKKMANYSLNNLPMEYYDDYEEALKIQNFFSYQLGSLLIRSGKKYNIFCVFVLPYQIVKLYQKKVRKND